MLLSINLFTASDRHMTVAMHNNNREISFTRSDRESGRDKPE